MAPYTCLQCEFSTTLIERNFLKFNNLSNFLLDYLVVPSDGGRFLIYFLSLIVPILFNTIIANIPYNSK